jgi:S1-C subfamily serine protease
MFDFDGNALAMAVPCSGRVALVPLSDLLAAVQDQRRPEEMVWITFGFRAVPVDSVLGALLGVDSGQVVTELLVGSPADRAGLRAGDVLVGGLGLPALAEMPREARLRTRRRNGVVSLEVPSDTVRAGEIEFASGPPRSPPGLTLKHLPPESRAARAGLRAEDRILQVGRDHRPTPVSVRRALADTVPVFLVYERAGVRRVLVLE